MANSSLREGQKLREGKVVKVVLGRRCYAEVLRLLAQSEEGCFNSYKEPIARVPRWLKEASAELERQAQKDGKLAMVSKNTQASASSCSNRVMALTKTHSQSRIVRDFVESGGCNQLVVGSTGEVLRAPAFKPPVMLSVGVTCSLNHELVKGLEGAINHTRVSAFNANQELCNLREWLRRLKGEVDVGLERLEVVFNKLESTGLGQGCKVSDWDPNPTRRFKPKRKKVYKPKVGVGSVSSPKGVKPSLAIQRLMAGEPSIAGARSSVRLGLSVVDGCLDCSKATKYVSVSPS